MSSVKEVQILEDLFDKDTPKVDLRHLADFFGVAYGEVASALNMESLSKNALAAPEGKVKTWLSIFNLLIEVINDADPSLSSDEIKQKMKVWLNLPRPEFENQTPQKYMLKGKSRKVKVFLEQLLG